MFDNQFFLSKVPKSVQCPFCSKDITWRSDKTLSHYNKYQPYELRCGDLITYIYTDDTYLCIGFDNLCEKVNWDFRIKIPFSKLYKDDSPFNNEVFLHTASLTFFQPSLNLSQHCKNCNSYHLSCRRGSKSLYPLHLVLGFKFEIPENREYDMFKAKNRLNTPKPIKIPKKETTIKAPEKESKKPEGLLDLGIEFGQNTDPNIVSTFFGIAVKHNDSWKIFDKSKQAIIEFGAINLESCPIFIVPTTNLAVGDLIKYNGDYLFIQKINSDNIQTICAKTGELKNIVHTQNLFGFSCYSKLIALNGTTNISENSDLEKVFLFLALSNHNPQNFDKVNPLLPLLLNIFKNKQNTKN